MSSYSICYEESEKLLLSLSENGDCNFPLNLAHVIKNYFPEIELLTYEDLKLKLQKDYLPFVESILKEKLKIAFIFKIDNRQFIAYDEKQNENIIRFALAHELGHHLLCHDANIESDSRNIENQANCFARNLLSPVKMQQETLTQNQIMDFFGLSPDAARVRISLYKIDFWHTKNLYESIGLEMDFVQSKFVERIEFDGGIIRFECVPI